MVRSACAVGALMAIGVSRAGLFLTAEPASVAAARADGEAAAEEEREDRVVSVHDTWLNEFAALLRPNTQTFVTQAPPPRPETGPVVSGIWVMHGEPTGDSPGFDLGGVLPAVELTALDEGEIAGLVFDYGSFEAGTEDPDSTTPSVRGVTIAAGVGGGGAAAAAGGGASGSGRPGAFAAGTPVAVPSPGAMALVALAAGLVAIPRGRR